MNDLKARVRVSRVVPAPEMFSGHLSGVRFEPARDGVNFQGATFENVDFSGLRIEHFHVSGSTFERCDFRRSVLRGGFSVPPRSEYRDCLFDRADLRQCNPGLARFERCAFDGAKLDGWDSTHAAFIECHFSGRMRNVSFSGGMHNDPTLASRVSSERVQALLARPQQPNEFRGNDFRGADLDAVEFRGGIDLDAQLLPVEPEYLRSDIRPETLSGVESYVRTLPSGEQAKALRLLTWLRSRYRNQPEVFTKSLGGSFGRYQELLTHLGND
jgi:uncharacterized protein YjbI with pentapeptide repeats